MDDLTYYSVLNFNQQDDSNIEFQSKMKQIKTKIIAFFQRKTNVIFLPLLFK